MNKIFLGISYHFGNLTRLKIDFGMCEYFQKNNKEKEMFKRTIAATKISVLFVLGKIIELMLKPLTELLKLIIKNIESATEEIISDIRI